MATTEADAPTFDGDAPDPREGVWPASQFLIELLLAPGLILRYTAHMVGAHAYGADRDAIRLRYGLGVGFGVVNPDFSTLKQLEIAALTAGFAGAWWIMLFGAVDWQSGITAILAVNAAVVIGDPLWIGIDHIRRTS